MNKRNGILRIGCAQADITPELPVLMGGSFLMFDGLTLHDPLMASCIVIDNGETRVALVSCDLGSVPQDMTHAIREQVNRATGTPCAHIHLMATHNHSCPTVFPMRDLPFHQGDAASRTRRETTRRKLVEDIAGCVIAAHQAPVPARMGYGRGRFDGGAFNRRFIMSNGRSRMHGGKHLERLRPEGPADPEVQTVWFEDTDGRPLAVMLNYAAHPSNLYGKPFMSADYPGVARTVLQGALGKNVPVMFLQGCCGNVMCDDLENPHRTSGMATAQRVGRAVAGETLRIMGDTGARKSHIRLAACNRILHLPYREPLLPVEEAREQLQAHRRDWPAFTALDIEERVALLTTLRIAGYRATTPSEPAEIAAVALDDVMLVSNQAELFVEYQLDIKARFKTHMIMVAELTNGRIGYVPTRLACALGGYETLETRFNPDAGEQIREASCELIERLIEQSTTG